MAPTYLGRPALRLATTANAISTICLAAYFAVLFSAPDGMTSFVLAIAGLDGSDNDVRFLVNGSQYLLPIAVASGFFAISYFAVLRYAGQPIDGRIAFAHFWLALVAVALWLKPQVLLWQTMPRRYSDYPEMLANWHRITLLGQVLFVFSILAFGYGIWRAFKSKSQKAGNPWAMIAFAVVSAGTLAMYLLISYRVQAFLLKAGAS
jgi:heme/copper-type cytochrome/quinol oxidase subunit 1